MHISKIIFVTRILTALFRWVLVYACLPVLLFDSHNLGTIETKSSKYSKC